MVRKITYVAKKAKVDQTCAICAKSIQRNKMCAYAQRLDEFICVNCWGKIDDGDDDD